MESTILPDQEIEPVEDLALGVLTESDETDDAATEPRETEAADWSTPLDESAAESSEEPRADDPEGPGDDDEDPDDDEADEGETDKDDAEGGQETL